MQQGLHVDHGMIIIDPERLYTPLSSASRSSSIGQLPRCQFMHTYMAHVIQAWQAEEPSLEGALFQG